jgi:hypothetical protein
MTATKRPVRSRSVLADEANVLATAIRTDGRHDHVTVRPDRGFLYVDVDEEPIVRLEPLSGDQYGLSFHHHTGRWEPTPFTGDIGLLARVVTTEFGAYLDHFDFPPTKSGSGH